jgi:hypothetical protein
VLDYKNDRDAARQPSASENDAATITNGPSDGISADCQTGGFTMPNPPSAGLPNQASYTNNGDGTVTDNVTGLVWEGSADATTYTQADAEQHCQAKAGGWRLPTRIELVSLIDFTIASPGPTINGAAFPNATADPFWTSSSSAATTDYGWNVTFYIGDANLGYNKGASKVRCVRGTPKCYSTRFETQAEAGEVHDNATGLTWQLTVDPSSRTWDDAKSYCAALGASWRLPSVNELQTIVDDTKSAPSIDSNIFPQTPAEVFWTSSAFVGAPGNAWFVAFSLGTASLDDVTSLSRVRCVRESLHE